MGAFDRKYSREVEDAVRRAWCDRGIRPARRIAELATAGELEPDLPAEPITVEMVYTWKSAELKARAGKVETVLGKMPPRDAIETLRLRLLNAADAMMRQQEKRKVESRDPERLRQIARLVREAAAIPGPTEPRPSKPGQRDPQTGEHNGSRTEGGLAASILASARRTETASPTPQPVDTQGDNGGTAHTGSSETAEQELAGTHGLHGG
jgi:hypothetical protein